MGPDPLKARNFNIPRWPKAVVFIFVLQVIVLVTIKWI